VSGDESITRKDLFLHAEVSATMRLEFVEFFKRAVIEQEFDAFTRGHLAVGVLAFNARSAATGFGSQVFLLEQLEFVFNHWALFEHGAFATKKHRSHKKTLTALT
jgi:hypothetical protein